MASILTLGSHRSLSPYHLLEAMVSIIKREDQAPKQISFLFQDVAGQISLQQDWQLTQITTEHPWDLWPYSRT